VKPRGRLLTLLIAAVLTVVVVGCGVKTEDAGGSSDVTVVDESTTTGDSGEDSTTQVTATDQTAGTAGPSTTEPTTTEPATTEPATTEPATTAPSLPPGVDEEQIKDQLATGFKSLGLDDTEATCLADAYIREFGVTTGAPDTSKMIDLFAECDIDPTKIGGGG